MRPQRCISTVLSDDDERPATATMLRGSMTISLPPRVSVTVPLVPVLIHAPTLTDMPGSSGCQWPARDTFTGARNSVTVHVSDARAAVAGRTAITSATRAANRRAVIEGLRAKPPDCGKHGSPKG